MLTAANRDRLELIRERTRNARSRRQHARQQMDAARDVSDQDAQAVASLAFDEADHDLQIAERLESQLLAQMAGIDDHGAIGRDSFLFDPGVIAELEQLAHSSAPVGSVNLGSIMSRGDWIGRYASSVADQDFRAPRMGADPSIAPDSASRMGPYYGAVAQLRRRLTLLDLIPSATMDGASFGYTQESGSFTTAAETAEGSVKPQGDVVLTDAEVHARTIAHWLKVQRQQLADVGGLAALLQTRLVYGVNLRLEAQVLNGDGNGENLLGILRTSGIGAPASGAGDTVNADLVLNGITAVLNSGAVPTGVVWNPTDHAKAMKVKATTSGVRLDSDGAFSVQVGDQVWNVPSILNVGMPAGTALVGDWLLGSTLFVREGIAVRVSDSDQDDFIRNKTTMLGEGRFGLAVWQPSAFAKVPLNFPA
jgi:Phage capsid family